MNERIKELAGQAGFYINSEGNIYIPTTDENITQVSIKFAELIVQECADRLVQDDFGGVRGMMKIAGARLKEHFGVES